MGICSAGDHGICILVRVRKALRVGTSMTKSGINVPYVLWLIAGLIPWFYFSDVINSGTNVLYEYSYLVKKVVFNISILPLVKLISALFVHLFFVGFMLLLFVLYHFAPTLFMLQVLYYSFALMVLCVGIVYFSSAVVVFFRDFSQMIGIVMQVWIWATPIMWNLDGMTLSPVLTVILKLNPLYYIVSGYRDAMIDQVWFWEKPMLTLYYWVITGVVIFIGTRVFKRLMPHFADVL